LKTKVTLARWLIDKTNSEAYRAGKLTGQKHPKVEKELIEAVGGMQPLLKQAKELEEEPLLGKAGKFSVDWRDMGGDIKKLTYDVSIIPELCMREGMKDPREHQLDLIEQIDRWKAEVSEYEWILSYYEKMLDKLERGKIVHDAEDGLLFPCLNYIVRLHDDVWERKLSSDVFHNSKKFKKEYQSRIATILRNHSPYYIDGMSDDELLAMHRVHSYAQTLEWKGAVQYLTDGEYLVDTSNMPYGTILNSQTLEHSIPSNASGCKRIMTIENKANYEDMTYSEDTIYIFCHGFFTPKEVRFLKKLAELVDSDCEFLHWGDMDFGGISIFLFNQAKVFPKLKPYKMDKESFQEALEAGAGMPLEESTRKKLEAKDAGILTGLKDMILETGKVVEQETFI